MTAIRALQAQQDGPVLVTGAGGFVGSEIVLALARAGMRVVATDQAFDPDTSGRLAAIERIEAPLPSALEQAARLSPGAVVHAAAITAAPDDIGLTTAGHVRRNMDMLTLCLDQARATGAGRFIFLSSSGVFRPEDGTGPLSELVPATGNGPYAAAKRAGEIVTLGAADAGFATMSLRLGNLFGPCEAPRPTRPGLSLLARMVIGASSGVIEVKTPSTLRDWTWLPDIGRAVATQLGQFPIGRSDPLHCGSGEVLSDLQLAQAVAVYFPGVTLKLRRGPSRAFKGPMISALSSVLSRFEWTPFHTALATLLSEPVSA